MVARSLASLRISSPEMMRWITDPRDQMSLSLLYGCPIRISGAMFMGVPAKVEVVPTKMRLMPKSISCASVTKTTKPDPPDVSATRKTKRWRLEIGIGRGGVQGGLAVR
eukprot:879736-Prorocentrum_minimum.AAC.2